MECTNCCSAGDWSPQRAVLGGETEVEIVLCDACRDALSTAEWIELEGSPPRVS
jgi:hypothetical protein